MADDALTMLMRIVAQDMATGPLSAVTRSIQGLGEKAKRSAKDLKDVDKSTKDNIWSLTKMDDAVVGLTTAFTGLKIVQFLGDLREQGEVVRKNTNTFRELTGGVQESTIALDQLRARTRGMISDTNLMASANNLLKSNLAGSAAEATKLIGISNDLGATTEQLFSVLANQSYAVLDSFGVSSGAVRQLKEQYTEAGMTSEEAFKEAFLTEAEKTIKRLGTSVEDNVSPSEKLKVKWQNFWDGVSAGAATTLNTALTTAEQLGFIIQNEFDSIYQQNTGMTRAFSAEMPTTPLSNVRPSLSLQEQVQQERQQALYGSYSYMNISPASGGSSSASPFGQFAYMNQQEMTGGPSALSMVLAGAQDAKSGLDSWAESLRNSVFGIDSNTEAQAKNTAALEASVTKMTELSTTVQSEIAKMLGINPDEQKAVTPEGAEKSVVSALKRSGKTDEEIQQILTTGGSTLDLAAAQGLDVSNPQTVLAAYGVSDSTPGMGSDASFTGIAGTPEEQLATVVKNLAIDQIIQGLSGAGPRGTGKGMQGAARTMGEAPTGISQSQAAFADLILGASTSPLYAGLGSESPANFGGMSYANMPQYQTFGPYTPGTEGLAPGSVTPANFGGADYSNLPAYTDETNTNLQGVADTAAIVADDEHMGAMPIAVQSANTELQTLQTGFDTLVAKPYTVEIIPEVKTAAAKDAFSKFIIETLKANGFNVK